MSYTDYVALSTAQQEEAIKLRMNWPAKDFHRFAFWVKPDGHLSRRNGHHRLTEAAGKEIDAQVAGLFAPARSKTDLADWQPGTKFSTVRT